MALAAELLGDRLTLLILREAFYGVVRFDDMREDIDASRSMLTERLNRLIEHGLMSRAAYREPGARTRHAYTLTKAGLETAPILIALMQWGEAHVTGEPAPIEVRHRQTGEPLRLALIAEPGNAVRLRDTTMVVTRKPEVKPAD